MNQKPKRPSSAYLAYCKWKRSDVKLKYPDVKKSAEQNRILAQIWSTEEPAVKKSFQDTARQQMDEYNQLMSEFKKQEPAATQVNTATKPVTLTTKKKTRNAFILFSMDYRKKIKENGLTIKSSEIMKLIGEKYRELSQEQRSYYESLARKEQEDAKNEQSLKRKDDILESTPMKIRKEL